MIWALADFLVWERHGPERDGACTVWKVMEGGVGGSGARRRVWGSQEGSSEEEPWPEP